MYSVKNKINTRLYSVANGLFNLARKTSYFKIADTISWTNINKVSSMLSNVKRQSNKQLKNGRYIVHKSPKND